MYKLCTLRIRRNIGLIVKPETERDGMNCFMYYMDEWETFVKQAMELK